jgi:hypothetical protein
MMVIEVTVVNPMSFVVQKKCDCGAGKENFKENVMIP